MICMQLLYNDFKLIDRLHAIFVHLTMYSTVKYLFAVHDKHNLDCTISRLISMVTVCLFINVELVI